MLDLNKLYNMDCMEGMAQFPDKYFELAIADPPYFSDYGKEIYPGAIVSTTGVVRNRFESKHWEIPRQKYFDELLRVSAHQIVWGINYFAITNLGSGRIVWDKKNDNSSFSKCEIAYCSLHKSVQIFRHRWNGMIQENMSDKEKRIHPTQKPVALYRWLLQHYAKPGDKILDTHAGSASSFVACIEAGHDYIGFEIDADYYSAACERVEAFSAQQSLFREAAE